MLQSWRHPVISYIAIFALAVMAALPAPLLANCSCRQTDENQASCCQASSSDETAACCCSQPAAGKTSCCSMQPKETTTADANACYGELAATQSCTCLGCVETPVAPPVVTPRAADAPRVDLTFLAIPAVGMPLVAEPTPVLSTFAPDEGYLPPPVRERFCVWTI